MEDQTSPVASSEEGVRYSVKEVVVYQVVKTGPDSVEHYGTFNTPVEANAIKVLLEDAAGKWKEKSK